MEYVLSRQYKMSIGKNNPIMKYFEYIIYTKRE